MKQGFYEILIVITDAPHILSNWRGVSAAAWGLTFPTLNEHGLGDGTFDTVVSDGAQSDESEAALLALNAAISLCGNDFPVEVLVCQTWICDGISGGADRWKLEGWKDRPNHKLWEEFLRIRDEKQLRIFAQHLPASHPRIASQVRLFRKWARKARDRRSEELGTPAQKFGPV